MAYTKKTWASGDVITAEDMNNLENGVENASNDLSTFRGDEFSETEAYAINDYCIYDNVLYKFTAAKEAGSWNDTVVEATTVAEELGFLTAKSDRTYTVLDETVTTLNNTVTTLNNTVTALNKTYSVRVTSNGSGQGYLNLLVSGVTSQSKIQVTPTVHSTPGRIIAVNSFANGVQVWFDAATDTTVTYEFYIFVDNR